MRAISTAAALTLRIPEPLAVLKRSVIGSPGGKALGKRKKRPLSAKTIRSSPSEERSSGAAAATSLALGPQSSMRLRFATSLISTREATLYFSRWVRIVSPVPEGRTSQQLSTPESR
jgi:hypothetical protein